MAEGQLTKESILDVFTWLAKNEDKTIKEAITALEIKMLTSEELSKIIDTIITAHQKQINEMGNLKALGFLIGLVMKEVRGKANPEIVTKILSEKLKGQ